ncbi:MAG: DUF937 domain-containing protein [Dehalococcoidia bacterium]
MTQASTLLNGVLSDQSLMQELAKRFGLPEETVQAAAESMVPALARGIENNIQQPGGAESLINAVQTGDHQRYLNDPSLLEQPASIEDGNAILGHVFGSKDVSRNVAAFASEKTGVDSSILKQMLPVLGAAVMGILAQKMSQGGAMSTVPQQGGGTGGLMDVLGGFLDADKDGSMMDDLLGMAQKFMQPRGG